MVGGVQTRGGGGGGGCGGGARATPGREALTRRATFKLPYCWRRARW